MILKNFLCRKESFAASKGEAPFLIILDGITDPHNLGAVIRTAECTGVHGIIIPQHRSVGLSPSAVKSSAGAVEYVKVARVGNLARTIEDLQKKNIWFYAVTMNGTDYRKTSFDGGVGLVIGSEEDGISRLVAEKCDYAVSLPMKGRIESPCASPPPGVPKELPSSSAALWVNSIGTPASASSARRAA